MQIKSKFSFEQDSLLFFAVGNLVSLGLWNVRCSSAHETMTLTMLVALSLSCNTVVLDSSDQKGGENT